MYQPLPPLKKDQEFGELKVKSPEYDKHRRVLVVCVCLNEFWVRHTDLRAGKTSRCSSCTRLRRKKKAQLKVSRGEIYAPWEMMEDAAGASTRVRVRCTGCNQRTTRKLFGLIEGKHKQCLHCFNKSRGSKFVIFEGRTISLMELMNSSETLTIVASSIQATPRETITKQVRDFIAESGQIVQTPQAITVQVREGQ